jgi:hypothetical protein
MVVAGEEHERDTASLELLCELERGAIRQIDIQHGAGRNGMVKLIPARGLGRARAEDFCSAAFKRPRRVASEIKIILHHQDALSA